MKPTAILVDLNDREAWLEARTRGIGSSDAAAILGLDPFNSPMGVFVSKVDRQPDEDNEAMEFGRRLEGVVADKFADDNPSYFVEKAPCMYAHAEYPWMMSNPDRLLSSAVLRNETVAILECKTSSHDAEYDERPSDRVLLQVQHQLAVMDLPTAWVAVLIAGRRYKQWEVARDDAAIELLIEIESEFWANVESGTPPATDGSVATANALNHLYETAEEAEVPIDVVADLLPRLRTVKDRLGELSSEKMDLEAKIKAILGHATRGTVDGEVAVTWNPVRTFSEAAFILQHPDLAAEYREAGIDTDALKRDHRDLFEEFRRPAHRRLVVK